MTTELQSAIASRHQGNDKVNFIDQQIANLPFGLDEFIQIQELDKKYTHANHKRSKCNLCNIEGCKNKATHWLTRRNSDYCRSDLVCNQHAMVWMQVKNLISESAA
jgi:hypothetical protein